MCNVNLDKQVHNIGNILKYSENQILQKENTDDWELCCNKPFWLIPHNQLLCFLQRWIHLTDFVLLDLIENIYMKQINAWTILQKILQCFLAQQVFHWQASDTHYVENITHWYSFGIIDLTGYTLRNTRSKIQMPNWLSIHHHVLYFIFFSDIPSA